MSSFEKILRTIEWGEDPKLDYNDVIDLYNYLMYLAREIRPKHTIKGCIAGDPRYVWDAMIKNTYKAYSEGTEPPKPSERDVKIDNMKRSLMIRI